MEILQSLYKVKGGFTPPAVQSGGLFGIVGR